MDYSFLKLNFKIVIDIDLATVVGFFVVSRPFFSTTHYLSNASASERLEVGILLKVPNL